MSVFRVSGSSNHKQFIKNEIFIFDIMQRNISSPVPSVVNKLSTSSLFDFKTAEYNSNP